MDNNDTSVMRSEEASTCDRGRTVLVCLDEIETSEAAFRDAVALYYQPGDVFILHHVICEYTLLITPERLEALKMNARKFIQDKFVPVLLVRGIKFTVDIQVVANDLRLGAKGTISETICQRARDLDVTAITLFSRQTGMISRILFTGSVLRYCKQHSTVPVVNPADELTSASPASENSVSWGAPWRKGCQQPVFGPSSGTFFVKSNGYQDVVIDC